MEIKCAWCEKLIGIKKFKNEDSGIPLVTHSICKACHQKVLQDEQIHVVNRTGASVSP